MYSSLRCEERLSRAEELPGHFAMELSGRGYGTSSLLAVCCHGVARGDAVRHRRCDNGMLQGFPLSSRMEVGEQVSGDVCESGAGQLGSQAVGCQIR